MRNIIVAIALLLLAACGSEQTTPTGVKLGKPYSVNGQNYTPQYDATYDETGIASWYGPGFHGNKTANGETYDQSDFTAAHRTLPMPSLVRVTNTQNNSSIIVRINDRGPFAAGRIIDLSKSAARALGITGTAKVRVQFLQKETERYWSKLHLKADDIQFAANDPNAPQPGASEGAEGEAADKSAPVVSVGSADIQASDLKPISDTPRQVPFKVVESDSPKNGKPLATANQPKIVPLTRAKAAPVSAKQLALDETTTDTPPAAAAPASGGGSGWYVQAGSFSSEANAQKLANRLNSIGATVIDIVEAGGKTLHRLRVGPFADRASAQQALASAASRGASGAWVVKE